MAQPLSDDAARPVLDPLEPLLGYQLRRASAAMLADLNRSLADIDLRATEASVIMLIEYNPDITQSELGRVLGIQRANMAPLTATLRDRGLIDTAPVDGRSQALRLNPRGHDVAQAVRQRIEAHEARFLPELTGKERQRLAEILRHVWHQVAPAASTP